jgi:hypothetical protein
MMPADSETRTPVSMNSRMIGGVATVGEVATVARLQEAAELVVGQERWWFVGELRRFHADHRARLEFAFGDAPLEEGLEASVAVQRRGGLPALELVRNEVADVRALDRVHSYRVTSSGEEVGEQPDGLGVALDRALALVLRTEGAAEAGVKRGERGPLRRRYWAHES